MLCRTPRQRYPRFLLNRHHSNKETSGKHSKTPTRTSHRTWVISMVVEGPQPKIIIIRYSITREAFSLRHTCHHMSNSFAKAKTIRIVALVRVKHSPNSIWVSCRGSSQRTTRGLQTLTRINCGRGSAQCWPISNNYK